MESNMKQEKYLSFTEEEKERCVFMSTMYIWMLEYK